MSQDVWQVGLVFSTITAVTFLGVALLLARALQRGKQWRHNPLAVATMAIFLTCGTGHAIHSWQMLQPDAIGVAARIQYAEWHLWAADGGTAIAGTFYLISRKAYPNLVSGAAMYENARRQQRRAVEVHDNIVQALVKTKWSLDLKDAEGALAHMDAVIAKSEMLEKDIGGPR